MKKILSILFVAVLLGSVSVTAFAQTTTGEDVKNDVKAKYVNGVTTPEVCSVDVTWGSMEFTYSESGTKNWDPKTHTYSNNITSGWTAKGNKVSVTNHSNMPVSVNTSFAATTDFASKLNGVFDKASFTLSSAEGAAVADAPNDSSTLTLSGSLESEITDFTKVGTVTVKLSN